MPEEVTARLTILRGPAPPKRPESPGAPAMATATPPPKPLAPAGAAIDPWDREHWFL